MLATTPDLDLSRGFGEDTTIKTGGNTTIWDRKTLPLDALPTPPSSRYWSPLVAIGEGIVVLDVMIPISVTCSE